MDTHELAWAAGFFDGEGTTLFYRPGGTRELRLAVNQVDREVLDRFHAALGGISYISGPFRYASMGRRRPQWRWQAGRFGHVQAGIAMLWKFLGTVKRKQAAEALRGYHAVKVRRCRRRG